MTPALASFAATALAAAALTVTDLPGTWSGFAVHDGDTTALALEVEPAAEGRYLLKGTIPAIHVKSAEFGQVRARVSGDSVALGPFRFVHDPRNGALVGTVPAGLLPVYEVPLVLERATELPKLARVAPDGLPQPAIAWSYATNAPSWAGPVVAGARVYAGDDSGRVHCLNARTGTKHWSFRTGGPVRGRVLVAGRDLYVASDDGLLYRLDVVSGARKWAVKVESTAVVRKPIGDPASIYDRYGSDPVMGDELLYLGTHDGRVLALDPETGAIRWQHKTGGPVLAAVRSSGSRVYAGSYDGRVYALDAATGAQAWSFDTRGPVVSTPALAGDRVIVGSRSYDLYALAVDDGRPLWKRYSWFSWVESSPTIREGVAYVGSSDASAIHAYDVATGDLQYKTDVHGWAWGQPAVDERNVYIGTVGSKSTDGRQVGAIAVIDRASGKLKARLPAPQAGDGQFGFAGSPALGADGMAYFTALDGRIVALQPR